MCKLDQLNPAKFHTVLVKESQVQRLHQKGYREGSCEDICATLCPKGEECITENGQGKCVRQCRPPSPCEAGQECQCSCVTTRTNRFLMFRAANQKVPMCLIERTSPSPKFRTIRVWQREVQANLDKGYKRGSCDNHCGTLCPGMTCSLENEGCASLPEQAANACTGVTSCSKDTDKCICECKPPTKAPSPCNIANCNDDNLCTVDTCDPNTGTCQNIPVACTTGNACDPYDSKCHVVDAVTPCVAVIDEWDDYNKTEMDTLWNTFRTTYPTRPFCLLVPEEVYNKIPTYFDADNLKENTVDRTIRRLVQQDHGDDDKVSNWFNICRLGKYSASKVDHVDFFLDSTESMPTNHIPKSLAKFKRDCANIGLKVNNIVEDVNYKENWIAPFLLVPTNVPSKAPSPCNIANCDDKNLCTVDTCDPNTGTCQNTPVACTTGNACDPFDGKCHPVDAVTPCVAVIDEWDEYDKTEMDTLWNTFRTTYPTRPFCLLVPEEVYDKIPTHFDADNLKENTVDRTIRRLVQQDHGDVNKVSDWFNICRLGEYRATKVDHVDFFLDSSESMPTNHIPKSLAKFKSDCSNIGLKLNIVVEDIDYKENWIAPFLLVPPNVPTTAPPPCNIANCNDKNLCTVDTCDATTGTCQNTPVTCSTGEACDPYDGQCRTVKAIAPCVAVIDDWDDYDKDEMDNLWSTYRTTYPTRPFCLLVPEEVYDVIPTHFDADNFMGNTIDRTIRRFVEEDHGDVNKVSDWFNFCRLGAYAASEVNFVDFFVASTESMPNNHIPKSLQKFKSDCSNIGLAVNGVAEVVGAEENWITPFLPAVV